MPTDRTEVKDTSPKHPSHQAPPPPPVPAKGGRSWAAKFRRKSEDHQHEKKKQLQDYTAWVNNYLRRKPGVPQVNDLRANLQDGITFVNLIEIVAHAKLEGVDRYPTTASSRRCNVERAIDFLKLEGITFQGDPAKDILDGNSKAIMRVVLGLAERYQPRSVRQRSASDVKTFFSPGSQSIDHNGSRDHMTYSLHTERQMLKGSQSPEGNISHRLSSSSFAANSSSVPNMVSMNVHAGVGGGVNNRVGVSRSGSGSGHRYYDGPPHPIVPARSPGYAPPTSSGIRKLSQTTAAAARHFQYPDKPVEQVRSRFPQSHVDRGDRGDRGDRDDTYATPADTLPMSAGTRIIPPMKRTGHVTQQRHTHRLSNIQGVVPDNRRRRAVSSPAPVGGPGPGIAGVVAELLPHSSDPALSQEMNVVLSGLTEFKSELLQLHALLHKNSDGSLPEALVQSLAAEFARDSEEDFINEDDSRSTPTGEAMHPINAMPTSNVAVGAMERDIVEARSENVSLLEQISQLQDEFTQTQSECATLRSMLDERNTFITTMKSEIYRKEYRNDTQRVDLQNQILQKEGAIKKLEAECVSIKESLEAGKEEQANISNQLQKKEEAESDLHDALESLRTDITRLKEAEDVLQAKVASRDKKIGHLEDKIAELHETRNNKRSDSFSDDTDNIRESLGLLRASLSLQDPQQVTIDALEKSISEMMSHLLERSGSPSGKKSRRHRDSEDHHRERDRDRRKRHKEKHSIHNTSTETRTEQTTPSPTGGGVANDVTKVFYYMLNDKTETPYVTPVPGKSNEITLHDFKSVFDRQGTFRFYFKTEDPDCGIVKEEITGDDQILPNWKGKILVWVSEKCHSR